MEATETTSQHASTDSKHAKDDYITGLSLVAVVGSVTLVCFLILLDQSILSTAMPQITSHFHSLPDVGWYAGAYQLASATLQPLTGKLYTHFRAKYTFLAFLFVFELGSLLCGAATTSPMLIVGRAVAGLGASGLVNGGMTVVSGAAPLEKRPLYNGFLLGVAQLGLISGPLIGGALTEYATWRWCFYINLPLGGLAVVILLFIDIPDITAKPAFTLTLVRATIPKLDLIGFALFAPASVMLLLALQYGSANTYAWSSSVVIGLFSGTVATFLVFVVWEWREGDNAMIPGSIIKQRVVWASCLQSMSLMGVLIGASNYLPIYFQAVKGVSPTMSGVDMLPSILSQLLMALLSGVAVSRLGYYTPWAIFSGAISAVGNGLISTFRPHTPPATWIGYQILLGAARGAGMQMSMLAVQTHLPPSTLATSLAILIFSQNLAGSVSVVLATTIFTESLKSNLVKFAPQIALESALEAGGGAQAVRDLVRGRVNLLAGLLEAYSASVANVFYFLVGLSVVGFVASWGMGWGDVRSKKGKASETGGGEKTEQA
ncbi:efflux pump protein [Polyplosphaeria fusca]|uniref:Efflux pump protein n=1 Tax=Polyplosphaeria fusca TaxID=682080 RepID=A0A9P4R510_9PLEO|nr:efflux pump protein [Polyplosphaeria fusca]